MSMKSVLFAALLVSTVSSAALANELCGTIGSHMVGPKCEAGRPCPMWVRLQYDLTTDENESYDLETSTITLFDSLGQLEGKKACVVGEGTREGFTVTSITAQ